MWSVPNVPGPSCRLPVFCSSLWSLFAALSSWETLDEPGVPTGLVSAFLPQHRARRPQAPSRLPNHPVLSPLLALAPGVFLLSVTFLCIRQVFGSLKLYAWVQPAILT